MVARPFEIKNIVTEIFISDTEGNNTIYDPNLGIIELRNGYLEYVTLNESHDYVSEKEESCEGPLSPLRST